MGERVGVKIEKDTQLYQKFSENSAIRANAYLPEGAEVETGDSGQIERLVYDHQLHEFVPLLGREPDDGEQLLYLRTEDLPENW